MIRESIGRTFKTPRYSYGAETGRSMVEMLGTLAIISVLSMASLWGGSGIMNRFRANDLLQEASARAMRISEQIKKGRKTLSLGKFSHNETMGGTFSKQVFTSGLYQQFAIQVSDVNKSVCERVLNSITENTPLRRLSLVNSPTVAITECNDENTFLMVYNSSIKGEERDKKYCESDKDCDTVCGECNENHICRNECEIPRPDLNSDFGQECGENECVVYDEESQTCKYSCERVEYLESTGTQWIDTSYPMKDIRKLEIIVDWSAHVSGKREMVGGGTSGSYFIEVGTTGFYGLGVNNYSVYSVGYKDKLVWIYVVDSYPELYVNDNFATMDTLLRKPVGNFMTSLGNSYIPYAKFYLLQIYTNNNTLVRDFIPVIAPDGEACMFDKVSKKLFRNSGTGRFKTNLDE